MSLSALARRSRLAVRHRLALAGWQAKANVALSAARFYELPALDVDTFGRARFAKHYANAPTPENRNDRFNPVAILRYHEFGYACRQILDDGPILDISSPRLLGLWLADQGRAVTMLNPDERDLARTRRLSAYQGNQPTCTPGDARRLPFGNDAFASIYSLSVFEHIGTAGDPDGAEQQAIAELGRVLRPGGRAVLTVPVRPEHTDEFREHDYYGDAPEQTGRFFFQRHYSEASLRDRLLQPAAAAGLEAVNREYVHETPVGWFDDYVERWQAMGLALTVFDPLLASRHWQTASTHPTDRFGNCHITLVKP